MAKVGKTRWENGWQALDALSISMGIFLLLLAVQGCGNYRSETAFERGVDAVEGQNYDLAIAEFSDAIRLKPDYVDAYNNRGVAYNGKGDYDRAIADETQAIRLDPNQVRAYCNRANDYAHKGDWDKAIADCNEAIRLESGLCGSPPASQSLRAEEAVP